MSFDVNKIIMESLQELNEAWAPQWSSFSNDNKPANVVKKTVNNQVGVNKPLNVANNQVGQPKGLSTELQDKYLTSDETKPFVGKYATPSGMAKSATEEQEKLKAAAAEKGKKEYQNWLSTDKKAPGDFREKTAEQLTNKHIPGVTEKAKELDKEEISTSNAVQTAAEKSAEEDAAEKAKNLDNEGISASKAIQKAADDSAKEEAAEAARKAARHAQGLDAGVDTHLKKAGTGLYKKIMGQERTSDEGVKENLGKAVNRGVAAFKEGDPLAYGGVGAAGIAAGLGALSLAKRLRKTKRARA